MSVIQTKQKVEHLKMKHASEIRPNPITHINYYANEILLPKAFTKDFHIHYGFGCENFLSSNIFYIRPIDR